MDWNIHFNRDLSMLTSLHLSFTIVASVHAPFWKCTVCVSGKVSPNSTFLTLFHPIYQIQVTFHIKLAKNWLTHQNTFWSLSVHLYLNNSKINKYPVPILYSIVLGFHFSVQFCITHLPVVYADCVFNARPNHSHNKHCPVFLGQQPH